MDSGVFSASESSSDSESVNVLSSSVLTFGTHRIRYYTCLDDGDTHYHDYGHVKRPHWCVCINDIVNHVVRSNRLQSNYVSAWLDAARTHDRCVTQFNGEWYMCLDAEDSRLKQMHEMLHTTPLSGRYVDLICEVWYAIHRAMCKKLPPPSIGRIITTTSTTNIVRINPMVYNDNDSDSDYEPSTPMDTRKRKRASPPRLRRKHLHEPRRLEFTSSSSSSSSSSSEGILSALANASAVEDASGGDNEEDTVRVPPVHMTLDRFIQYVRLQNETLAALAHARAVVDDQHTRTTEKMNMALVNQFRRVAQLTPVSAHLFANDNQSSMVQVQPLPEGNGDRLYSVYERISILGFDPSDYNVVDIGREASIMYQDMYDTYPLKDERAIGHNNMMTVNVYTRETAQQTVDIAILNAVNTRQGEQ